MCRVRKNLKIHIITAALPPQLDGIGDYTANLAAELAHSATVTVLTGAPAPDSIPGVRVETAFSADDPRSVWNLVDRVAADPPDWVLLQYNPFSYGRWGLNLHLPRVMQGIKRRCPGAKFALMVHEPFVPIISPQFAVMATWQRWQLWALGRSADRVFFSIGPWAKRFQKWFPHTQVRHLPVGSNIPLVPTSRAEARERLGIPEGTFVLGLFGTMHISRMLERVRGAAQTVLQSGQEAVVLYIGKDEQIVRLALGDVPLLAGGPFSAEESSRRFAIMDVQLAPFTDGISTRRTSVMCGLQHGVATVGTHNYNTDAIFMEENGRSLLLAPVDDAPQFNMHVLEVLQQPALRVALADSGQRLYQKHFGWDRIAAQLCSALSGAGGSL